MLRRVALGPPGKRLLTAACDEGRGETLGGFDCSDIDSTSPTAAFVARRVCDLRLRHWNSALSCPEHKRLKPETPARRVTHH